MFCWETLSHVIHLDATWPVPPFQTLLQTIAQTPVAATLSDGSGYVLNVFSSFSPVPPKSMKWNDMCGLMTDCDYSFWEQQWNGFTSLAA